MVYVLFALRTLRPKYLIRDDVLFNGRANVPLRNLTHATEARVHTVHVQTGLNEKSNSRLALTIDGIRIQLNDRWMPNYYEPDSLLAIAASLAKSPNPDAHRAATWLRQMAAEAEDSGY